MKEELKPCPFCGGTDIKLDAVPAVAQFYRCERCKAKGPYWIAGAGAKELWNVRPILPKQCETCRWWREGNGKVSFKCLNEDVPGVLFPGHDFGCTCHEARE